ncbi:FAD-dependent oxidoreductase [Litorilinea aerophila]|uniref:NAD(P)/FAD-dependent oxidoreductase n=2 Tax=Litorilinea aerophila TaxID=1204385 RepID=A0A540VJB7_9CHLR|nr:FAD-dependent oxidoreductase [Litorilinea aerophila]
MQHQNASPTVAIVGGGLAGLTAAALLARAGADVTLLEQAREIGGRARTQRDDGFHFNLGPHALYQGSPALTIFAELGVPVPAGRVAVAGYAIHRGRLFPFPATGPAILASRLLGLADKWALLKVLARLEGLRLEGLGAISIGQWIQEHVRPPVARAFLHSLIRLTTYSHAPEELSADAGLEQLRLSTRGVLYVDGGWQTLVDGLQQVAEAAGARLLTGTRAEAVTVDEQGTVTGLRLADGHSLPASAVLVAASPETTAALLPPQAPTLRRLLAQQLPVQAACLDLGLSRLPRPAATFALGVDAAVYFSVHSAAARLAPDGRALIHAARYLPAHPRNDPESDRRELEEMLDRIQPGWRGAVVKQRWLPRLTVCHGLPRASLGGLAGRPGPLVAEVPGLYLAGDWIGPEGLLANASLASARQATQAILASAHSQQGNTRRARVAL